MGELMYSRGNTNIHTCKKAVFKQRHTVQVQKYMDIDKVIGFRSHDLLGHCKIYHFFALKKTVG